MEQFPSAEKRYTSEDLEKAEQELSEATERFNSFDDGKDMLPEKEAEYMAGFSAAKSEYLEKANKVKEIEAELNR